MLDKTLTIKLDTETWSQIETLAQKVDQPNGKIARIMLMRHLAEHGPTPSALAKPKIQLMEVGRNDAQQVNPNQGSG